MAPKRLGRMLKALRTSKDMGLRELADKAEVPFGYLSELERGKKTNPSLAVLQRLARALGVKLEELVK
jgi:XRE family transcriptional regulator, master regulator for biofilm formation